MSDNETRLAQALTRDFMKSRLWQSLRDMQFMDNPSDAQLVIEKRIELAFSSGMAAGRKMEKDLVEHRLKSVLFGD